MNTNRLGSLWYECWRKFVLIRNNKPLRKLKINKRVFSMYPFLMLLISCDCYENCQSEANEKTNNKGDTK